MPYTQDNSSHWKEIEALFRAGITSGTSRNPPLFSPDANVTRAQMAVLLTRAMKLDPNSAPLDQIFSDVSSFHWAFKFIQLMAQKGIISAYPGQEENQNFYPDEAVSRAEAAKWLINVLLISDNNIDITPPSTPKVTDEGIYTSKTDQLYAAWSSSDPESGISEYQYQILDGGGGSGEFEGATVVRVFRDWTSTSTNDYVTAGGLGLQNGRTYYFAVKAKNGAGLWSEIGSSDGITVKINHAPVLNPIGNKTVNENKTLIFTVNASDPDGDNLKELKALNLPEGAKFEILPGIDLKIYPQPNIQGMFTWTPDYTQAGEYKVTFIASDGELTDEETITIVVNDFNPLPVSPDLAAIDIKFYKPQSQERPQDEIIPIVGQIVTCKAILNNIGKSNTGIFNVKWFLDGRQVGYGSHSNLSQGETSNDNVRFDWTPTVGMHTLRFVADCDNHVLESNEKNNSYTKTVWVRNLPPIAKIIAKPTSGYSPIKVQFRGDKSYDPDGKITSYRWMFGDGGSSNQINPAHIYNNYTSRTKIYNATLIVTDNQGLSSTSRISITVYPRRKIYK